ncbi:extracellular solute-binding protein [Anaerotalea alkaliphila]|uniref:Extracellular solute-binding protein n=1 Tax=Anaerotalea alkaliphila TaxID=2662126 RepID=A0A7X5HW88_9FIRM|nr:extracellular solute-binding protein [Anaerotalea alkaliphila]NDL67791.1 extracellular solute-binding protein [Anaerotalea alkaliphila]
MRIHRKLSKTVPGLAVLLALALSLGTGCVVRQGTNPVKNSVVVYTSVDQNYAELVFADFQEKTGITVLGGFDTEASKTTGMVNKLVEESKNPRADVFWNGEFAQTLLLAEKGVLAPYGSPAAEGLPSKYRDGDGLWTAFGGRARCILVNTDLLDPEEYPTSLLDFTSGAYPAEKTAIALPLFGTTATQGAALYGLWGPEAARDWFASVKDSGVRIVDGNGVVRDLVADGQLLFGLTDTDDALGAVEKGAPVEILFPDQGPGADGTLMIPNTVALVKNPAQNPNAKAFIDYLLSPETEQFLLDIGWIQAPLREGTQGTVPVLDTYPLDLEEIYGHLERSKEELSELYLQ